MSHRIQIRHDRCDRPLLAVAILALILIGNAQGQTTQFIYQGKLNDNGNAPSGPHDFQFRLFDSATVGTGTQHGSTIDVPNVSVTAGIFTVQLDFGAAVFPGADRYLEISVRPAGAGAFTLLAPRQAVSSTPYALRSTTAGTADTAMNAVQLGGLTSSGFIQNTTSQQAATDFNIGGTGSANILNAQTQFDLGGQRFMSASANGNVFIGSGSGTSVTTGERNTFVGLNAGAVNQIGTGNSFFGASAGSQNVANFNSFFGDSTGSNNTGGSQNSFFGGFVGYSNLNGSQNSFFGYGSGLNNTAGSENSFFGVSSGVTNTTGSSNSYFGFESGRQSRIGNENSFFGSRAGGNNDSGSINTFIGSFAGRLTVTGNANSFVGASAGFNNTTGNSNLFFGASAGIANATGSKNTILGANANLGANNLTNAAAVGFGAFVTQNNSLILGGITGINSGSDTNVGIGTTAPLAKLHINKVEEGIRLQGRAVNNNNLGYMSFYDSAGNRMGYVGDGSPNDRAIFLAADAEDVSLITTAGRVLTASFTGNVLMKGGPNVLGQSLDTYAAQTVDTGNFKGLFTPNLFLSSLDTFLASPVHICARLETIGGGAGGYALVRCSSSSSPATEKTDVHPFAGGLEIINRLTPVSFRWKQDKTTDLGLNADEVAEIAPELVTRNTQGEANEVKENALSLLFINAIKQQQKQLEAQQDQIHQQQQQINALKRFICTDHPNAEVCKAK